MMHQEYINIVNLIKEKDFLRRAFYFENNDEKEYDHMFVDDDQKSEFSHIRWLYMSCHIYAVLVGLTKDDSIFTLDDEFEQDIICDNFFDIPFLFAEYSIMEPKDTKKILLTDIRWQQKVEDLKLYRQWCIDNNFKLKHEYVNYFD